MDERVLEHKDLYASFAHELSVEPTYTARRRNSGAVARAQNFGDLVTADQKVFSENCESRNNH